MDSSSSILCFKDREFLMKLYNDQSNAKVLNLFIYLLLPYMFRDFFKPIFRAGDQRRPGFKSAGYGDRARVLTPYPPDLNHCRSCTPALKMGLKKARNM
jgi:hypothetical protein